MDKTGPQHTEHASRTQSKSLLSIIFHRQQQGRIQDFF